MSKILSVIALSLLLVLFVAGCGGDGAEQAESTDQAEQTEQKDQVGTKVDDVKRGSANRRAATRAACHSSPQHEMLRRRRKRTRGDAT